MLSDIIGDTIKQLGADLGHQDDHGHTHIIQMKDRVQNRDWIMNGIFHNTQVWRLPP